MAAAVIQTHQLSRRFGANVAVDRLDLEVLPGEVFGYLGHNGAGKTTTVRLLNGVLSPSAGRAEVLGLDPTLDGPALRRRTGVLTETPSLEERLTARENLWVFAELSDVPRSRADERVAGLLADFGLADRADEKVGGYSRGMKQRLALARALLHDPELIFLDEPTSGLDPVATRHVHELVARLSRQEGRTVFLCTHNLAEAQRLCDRVAVLERGRLLALGTPAELARQLGQGLRLEIEVEPADQAAALAALRACPAVGEVAWDDGIVTVAGTPRTAIPHLAAALVAAGARLYRLTPREPSLEEVYFALHGEALGGEVREEVGSEASSEAKGDADGEVRSA